MARSPALSRSSAARHRFVLGDVMLDRYVSGGVSGFSGSPDPGARSRVPQPAVQPMLPTMSRRWALGSCWRHRY
jgi:hypothetical protein